MKIKEHIWRSIIMSVYLYTEIKHHESFIKKAIIDFMFPSLLREKKNHLIFIFLENILSKILSSKFMVDYVFVAPPPLLHPRDTRQAKFLFWKGIGTWCLYSDSLHLTKIHHWNDNKFSDIFYCPVLLLARWARISD